MDNGEMATLAASGVTAAAAVYSCGAAARMEAVRSARTLATSAVTRTSILDVSTLSTQHASHHRLMRVTFCEAVLLLLDWNSLMHHNRGFLSRETGLWLVRVIIHLSLRYLSLSTIYYLPTP